MEEKNLEELCVQVISKKIKEMKRKEKINVWKWRTRKLIGCGIGIIITLIGFGLFLQWALAFNRNGVGVITIFPIFSGLAIFAYFNEENFSKYEEKKKRKNEKNSEEGSAS